jgi:hypothetical protein
MLAVRDLPETMAFDGCLGFEVVATFGGSQAASAGEQVTPPRPPVWCMLKRDSVRPMFNHPGPGIETELPARAKDFQIFYLYPDDVHALHAEWQAAGIEVGGLRVTSYGMREFELRDPDGYWLWFGESTADPPTVLD